MLKSGIYLALLVWCVSGTIIYPTRGNHRTCKTVTCSYGTVCVQKVRYCLTSPCIQPKPECQVAQVERSDSCALLNCPVGSKCKQVVRQCVSPPCQQPPPICIKVSTPSHPTLCPPGMSPDVHLGRTKTCVSDGQCGSTSKCFSTNVNGPFICCSEKSATVALAAQPQLNHPPPQLVIPHPGPPPTLNIPRQQPIAHPHGMNHNQPPPPHYHHALPNQPIAQPQVINRNQPSPPHYHHALPNQPIAQSHRQAYPNVHPQQTHHQLQPVQQLHNGQVRHHTLTQPQAKPYAFINHQPSQNFHRGRNLQPPQYQTRQQQYDINAQPYLQSEPISSNTQQELKSRRYPDPWNRQAREPREIEVANPPTAVEVEVRSQPATPNQSCPAGYLPDFQRGREIPCIQDSQCQSGSQCLTGTGRRYVCCARETSPVHQRQAVPSMPRYDINRQQIVSYGNRRPTPRLSYPLPSETSAVINNSPRRQYSANQQRQPLDLLSFNSQYLSNKQSNLPYKLPGSNVQPQQQPKKKPVSGQMQVTCPTGFTANQVNGQNMVCASSSQCPEASECKSTGLFQGSICCSKSSGMGLIRRYVPRR